MTRIWALLVVIPFLVCFAAVASDEESSGLAVIPSVFVGTAPGCAPFPPGSNIVTSAWLTGMGLPDDGSSNVTPSTPPNRDPHFGLLFSKNGSTADCSAAQADINGAKGMTVIELGFDFRNGGHCGAGAPRFNVTTNDDVTHFFGCAGGTQTAAPQDPAQWTRVRFTPVQGFPPVIPGTTIKSIGLILDEGTDTPSPQDPNGVGLAVLDNIDVNGTLVTRGPKARHDDNNP
jgi:hypothetical protein